MTFFLPLFASLFSTSMSCISENVKIYCLVGPEPMDISITSTSQTCEIPSSDVMILEGHTSEV